MLASPGRSVTPRGRVAFQSQQHRSAPGFCNANNCAICCLLPVLNILAKKSCQRQSGLLFTFRNEFAWCAPVLALTGAYRISGKISDYVFLMVCVFTNYFALCLLMNFKLLHSCILSLSLMKDWMVGPVGENSLPSKYPFCLRLI